MDFKAIYFGELLKSVDPLFLMMKDGRVRTIQRKDRWEKLIKGHRAGIGRFGSIPIDKDGNARFGMLDLDVKEKVDGHYEVNQEKVDLLWRKQAFSRIRTIVGQNTLVYRSKSGGAHVYIPTRAEARLVFRMLKLLKEKFFPEFHVDLFPSSNAGINGSFGARFFWEYFHNQDNCVEANYDDPLSDSDCTKIVKALGGVVKDLSRSGLDFSYINGMKEVLQNLPWNKDKRLTDHYVKHTIERAIGGPVSTIKILKPDDIKIDGFHPVFDLIGRPVFRAEIVTVHGDTGTGKTTFVIREAPMRSLYISTEISPIIFKGIVETFRPNQEVHYVFSQDPRQILALMKTTDYVCYIIDSFQYIDFPENLDGNKYMGLIRAFATHTDKVVMIVSHDNRREGTGISKLLKYSSLGQLSTKILWIPSKTRQLWQKDTFSGIRAYLQQRKKKK